MHLRTLTFSSRMSSALEVAGRSIATTHSICNRWFCITSLQTDMRTQTHRQIKRESNTSVQELKAIESRISSMRIVLRAFISIQFPSTYTHLMMPNSSKYPPRPLVPKGSLKDIWMFEMLSRFHRGESSRLPKLRKER
jgi:hypothetical protein